jgi:hypothetical protein
MRQFFSEWTTKDYVTATIAVYGALLSTYTAWTKWRETRTKVRVNLNPAMLVGGYMHGKSMVNIGVANHGHVAVAFGSGSVALRVKGSRYRMVVPQPVGQALPHTLSGGTSMTVYADWNELKEAVRRQYPDEDEVLVRAEVTDQLERVHVSGWRRFNFKRKTD